MQLKSKKKKMAKLKINIHNIHPIFTINKPQVKRIAKLIAQVENRTDIELNVVFVEHEYIINLNRDFLDTDSTTDVISFPLNDADQKSIFGEIYINLDQVAEQAVDYNVTFFNEMNRIIIHGILHLFGYDDISNEKKQRMKQKEDFYLKKLEEDF